MMEIPGHFIHCSELIPIRSWWPLRRMGMTVTSKHLPLMIMVHRSRSLKALNTMKTLLNGIHWLVLILIRTSWPMKAVEMMDSLERLIILKQPLPQSRVFLLSQLRQTTARSLSPLTSLYLMQLVVAAPCRPMILP